MQHLNSLGIQQIDEEAPIIDDQGSETNIDMDNMGVLTAEQSDYIEDHFRPKTGTNYL